MKGLLSSIMGVTAITVAPMKVHTVGYIGLRMKNK